MIFQIGKQERIYHWETANKLLLVECPFICVAYMGKGLKSTFLYCTKLRGIPYSMIISIWKLQLQFILNENFIGFSFAFPVNLTIPVAISLLISACGLRNDQSCFFKNSLPDYLYWQCPSGIIWFMFRTNPVIGPFQHHFIILLIT